MKKSVLKDKPEVHAWVYLPNTDTLPQYFKQNDLIELSKACKSYRFQLKSQVLRRVNINTRVIKLLNIRSQHKKHEHERIINSLRFDFAESFHLVSHVIIKISFSNEYICKFFALFPKISNIKIIGHLRYGFNNLITTLHNSKHLEHIILSPKFTTFNSKLNSVYFSLFYRLKSINIECSSCKNGEKLPIDIIDSSFINLERLTVVNDHMLSKLSNGAPYLLYVEFFQKYYFNMEELNSFFTNNYQLKQVSISSNNLDENVVNSILALGNLYKLEIKCYGYRACNLKIYTENFSIKHFVYDGFEFVHFNAAITNILKMCKSLEVYQIFDIKYYDCIMSNEFPLIDTLLLTNLFYSNINKLVPKFSKFNKVKFRDGCRFGTIACQLLKYTYIQWAPKQDYSNDTDEFTLIRKPS
jgi:hypothetical protein